MASKFYRNFKSLNNKEDEETAFQKASKELTKKATSSIKGSVSDKELKFFEKLLPEEDKYI